MYACLPQHSYMPPAQQNIEKIKSKVINLTNNTLRRPETQNKREPTLIKGQIRVRLQADSQKTLSLQPPSKLTRKSTL